MKIAILSASFFLFGMILGAVLIGYYLNGIYERQYAILNAMELGNTAMQAEFIKVGNAGLLLDSFERTLPQYLIMVSQDPRSKGALSVDTAMRAVKRFYVCTRTPIPLEIVDILNSVEIPADMCAAEQ